MIGHIIKYTSISAACDKGKYIIVGKFNVCMWTVVVDIVLRCLLFNAINDVTRE